MASVAAIGFDVYGTLVDPLGIGNELPSASRNSGEPRNSNTPGDVR
jgi:hypothetical protein